MGDDEAELVARMATGDESVLMDVQQRFGPAARQHLRRRFARDLRPDEVEQVINDALFAFWQGRERFDSAKGGLGPWFLGVCQNTALKAVERGWVTQRRRELSRDGRDLDALPWRAPPADDSPTTITGPASPAESKPSDANGGGGDENCHVDSAHVTQPPTSDELLSRAREILAALSPCELTTLSMLLEAGRHLSSRELGNLLGASPGTIRARLKRARDKISPQCEQRGLPPPDWKRLFE